MTAHGKVCYELKTPYRCVAGDGAGKRCVLIFSSNQPALFCFIWENSVQLIQNNVLQNYN